MTKSAEAHPLQERAGRDEYADLLRAAATGDRDAVERLLMRAQAAAFGQRRKTLRNATRALLTPQAFELSHIDPGRRGETLSVEEFVALSDAST